MIPIKPKKGDKNTLTTKIKHTFIEVFLLLGFVMFYHNPATYEKPVDNIVYHAPHVESSSSSEPQVLSAKDKRLGNGTQKSAYAQGEEPDTNADVISISSTEMTLDTGVAPNPETTQKNKNNSNEVVAVQNNIKPIPQNPPNSTNKPATKNVPIVESTIDGGLGISAGGGLVYLGQKDLDIYFQKLKDLGALWVRWDIDWGVVQPYRLDSYEWEKIDRVANTAKRYDIRSLGIITYAPQWAQDSICVAGRRCPPKDSQLFANFAGKVAARYKGTVDTWEVWNEPNYNVFWYPESNVESYAALLRASYTEIKRNNPQATVLTGGLAAVSSNEGGNISSETFIRYLYDANLQGYFDAIALHPYTYPGSPSLAYGSDNWQIVDTVRQIMTLHGDGGKKIWLTEFGAPTGGSGFSREPNTSGAAFVYGSDYMSEGAQLYLAKDAGLLYAQRATWMGPFFWYSLLDAQGSSDPENFFGIIRTDGSKKPAYETIKKAFNF